jgi:hypothetical protein
LSKEILANMIRSVQKNTIPVKGRALAWSLGAAFIAIAFIGCATNVEPKGTLHLLGSFDSNDALRAAFETYHVPIVIIANKLYLPDSVCAKRRQHEIPGSTIAGDSAGRRLGGDSVSRTIAGDSTTRTLGGNSVSRTIAGDSAGRTLGGDSVSRTIAGDSTTRTLGGDSVSRTIAGDSAGRTLGGASVSPSADSNSNACGCSPSDDGRGFYVIFPSGTPVFYFDGTNIHSAVNLFVPLAN